MTNRQEQGDRISISGAILLAIFGATVLIGATHLAYGVDEVLNGRNSLPDYLELDTKHTFVEHFMVGFTGFFGGALGIGAFFTPKNPRSKNPVIQ